MRQILGSFCSAQSLLARTHRCLLALIMLATILGASASAGLMKGPADVSIQFSPDCKTVTTLKLGTLTASLDDQMIVATYPPPVLKADNDHAAMQATFTVTDDAKMSMIWKCMKL